MAATPDQLIKNLLSTIDESVLNYNESLPAIQKQVFAKVVELSRELELTRGRINPSVKNIRLIAQIKKELSKIMLTKEQKKKQDDYLKTFDTVDEINSRYFSTINEKFTPSKVFSEIKKQTIGMTISQLTNVNETIAVQVEKILSDNIKQGGMFNDFVEQMRTYLTDTKTGDGALVRYSKTITTDAINQYNANYNQLASADLGLVWYKYVGSLLKTSREWCIKLIHAKETCMPYIHESQFDDLVRGIICGEQVAIYDKTDLPYGMIDGTTAENLFSRRGGYGCGHQFYPVSSAVVPKNLRTKFEEEQQSLAADELILKARSSGQELENLTQMIKTKTGADATTVNYKSKDSIIRKAKDEYNGDFSKVNDTVRTTIIGDRGDISKIVSRMKKEMEGSIVNYKHQTSDKYMGYSGDLFNVRLKNGTIAEIQVNTPKMIYAKEDVKSAKAILGTKIWNEINKGVGLPGGLGHKYYEEWRLPTTSLARKLELIKLSEEYYMNFLD